MLGYGRWLLGSRIRVPGLVGAWRRGGISARGLRLSWLWWLRRRLGLALGLFRSLADVLEVRPEGGDGFLSSIVSHPQGAGVEGIRNGGDAPRRGQGPRAVALTIEDPSGPPSS